MEGCLLFVLYDGFLYVNGDIYMGYVLNKILKDFIVCYKLMLGFCVFYVLGWDIYGLLIEIVLIKNKKVNCKEMMVVEFCKFCE